MRYCLIFIFSIAVTTALGQISFRGIVADSISRQPLAFATIRIANRQKGILTGTDGQFAITLSSAADQVIVSYIGYVAQKYQPGRFQYKDTLFLLRNALTLKEVVILSQNDKIKRIVNAAVKNKAIHNPDNLAFYQCYIYYKMHVDLMASGAQRGGADSLLKSFRPPIDQRAQKQTKSIDTAFLAKLGNSHMVFSESFSRRTYKKPMQLQEDVIASRFSGLKKTYFTSLVTDVVPFHLYGDYISLNGKDFINPIAKGWQQHYHFRLIDEITNGADTTFILAFNPKKRILFNSMAGTVYINSAGYAISHFIATIGDSSSDREGNIEQVYTQLDGKWFPKELNYDVLLKKFPTAQISLGIKGHSLIDSVSFNPNLRVHFIKSRPITLADSIDQHSEQQWQSLRLDTITQKEKYTYQLMDSLSQKLDIEKKVSATGKLAIGMLAVGNFDLAFSRLIAFNQYEGIRLGMGAYTSDVLSKYVSVGGWAGYGFQDKMWKGGASFRFNPQGNKDNWFQIFFQRDNQSAGSVFIHPEVDKEWFRNWTLSEVDQIQQYGVHVHTQQGYWEMELTGKQEHLKSLYQNTFQFAGKKLTDFDVVEAGVILKYSYGQKRIPFFGYYLPYLTKYPIAYCQVNTGSIAAAGYLVHYVRATAALTYDRHFKRWGNDRFRAEGGIFRSFNGQGVSRSFLLAGKGFRNDQINYLAYGGFLTMHPYDYFSDRYVSFFYKHDFDRYLWQLTLSKPFISINHNAMIGGLSNINSSLNAGVVTPVHGYYESGLVLNQLVSINYRHLANINLNTGPYFHWSSGNVGHNLVWVLGLSVSF